MILKGMDHDGLGLKPERPRSLPDHPGVRTHDDDFSDIMDSINNDCREMCGEKVRQRFDCYGYLISYFEDDDNPPYYVSYLDTSSVQFVRVGDETYNTILSRRVIDAINSNPETFVKKISDDIP